MSTRSIRSFTEDSLVLPPELGGSHLGVRLWAGALPSAHGALVLHFHGGGFTSGSAASGAPVAQVLADHAALVASLEYPLAPAHPFPQAVEAGYAALQWLDARRRGKHRHAALYVAGEDAGGNIAAAVALMARDRGGPQLAGQILLSPMLDVSIGTASQREARDGPLGCRCADAWRAYLGSVADSMHPYATPGASLRLAGLPPTLLITSQDDPLRDETLAYAQRLRDAGVDVHASVVTQDTGWPCSYALDAERPRAPLSWIEPLRERVQPFLAPLSRTASPLIST